MEADVQFLEYTAEARRQLLLFEICLLAFNLTVKEVAISKLTVRERNNTTQRKGPC